MNYVMHGIGRLALVFCVFGASASWAAAQETTEICLKNGVTIHASRVQPRDGGFLITPKGLSGVPIDMSADQVKEIGSACAPGAAAQPQPQPVQVPAPQAASQPQAASSAQQQVQAPPAPAPCSEPPTWPRFTVAGSDAVGARLLPALVDAYAKKNGWTAAVSQAEGGASEIELSAPGAARPSLGVSIVARDSAWAVEGMLEHNAVFGMTSRRLTADEAKQINAKLHVDVLTPASGGEHVLALDALAVIVHPDNPIKRLGQDAIAGVFSGRIANWKDVKGWGEEGDEVSGRDAAIKVHTPGGASDSAQFFREFLTPSEGFAGSAEQHATDQSLSEAVARDPGAIGLAAYPHINKNYPLTIRSSCGLTSTLSRYSVKSEEYPLARRLYLYSLGEPKQQEAKAFLRFVLSDEAQKAVSGAGFIDQSPEYQDPVEQRDWAMAVERNPRLGIPDKKPEGGAPRRGNAMTELFTMMQQSMGMLLNRHQRTAIVFRFERNSINLDARARQDAARLARHVKSINLKEHPVTLIGFADWDGNDDRNFKLSLGRAQGILAELKRQGIAITEDAFNAMGMGPVAPVACNDTPEGKVKNRRVEVWVQRVIDKDN
jgi:phosphate transport system substrate-binding protein